MSGRDAELRVAGPACLKALRAYLAEVTRQTGLGAEVEPLGAPDVVFEGDDAAAPYRISWGPDESVDDEFADPEENVAGAVADPRIDAYARTAGALAESQALARAFLELLAED